MNDSTKQSPQERIQIIGWFVQVSGTVAMLLGIVLALAALPAVENGRFPAGSDMTPFFTLLIGALVVGIVLTIAGLVTIGVGKSRLRRAGGEVRRLRELLNTRQRTVGLLLVFVSFVALMATIVNLLVAIRAGR